MSIYKNSMGSKQFIESLGTVTLTAGPDTLKTINLVTFGQIKSAAIVINGATITGAAVLTWYGSTATSGGSLTAIAAVTIAISATTAVLQIDGEDISEAAEAAGLLPEGFLSLQCKIDGTSTDSIKAAIVVNPLHERVGLTPSSVTALT
jgi:formyltetrahydrofolate synthetase